MASERGLYSNLRSFKIANLADHDHIRVLPKNGAQGFRKTHVNTRIDLRLPDTEQLIFNWVLDRQHIGGGRVELAERGIQRGSFT